MSETRHYLLTRFNVGLYDRPDLDPDAWMRRRWELWDRFTWPSVQAQTVRDVAWLLVFDRRTPDRHLGPLPHYSGGFGRMVVKPLFIAPPTPGTFDTAVEAVRDELTRPEGAAGKLITTRLDNDDAVHRSFLQCIRDQAERIDFGAINFRNGYRLDRAAGRARTLSKRLNPFLSLVEPMIDLQTIRTCWAEQHDRMDRIAPVCDLTGEPLWVQVCHVDNLKNRPSGRARIPAADLAPVFGFEWS